MTERPTNDDVWLVIPVYNEGEVIRDVLVEAAKTFPNIVCVDDGSSDDSVARIREAAAEVDRARDGYEHTTSTGIHVVRHPVSYTHLTLPTM